MSVFKAVSGTWQVYVPSWCRQSVPWISRFVSKWHLLSRDWQDHKHFSLLNPWPVIIFRTIWRPSVLWYSASCISFKQNHFCFSTFLKTTHLPLPPAVSWSLPFFSFCLFVPFLNLFKGPCWLSVNPHPLFSDPHSQLRHSVNDGNQGVKDATADWYLSAEIFSWFNILKY